MLNILKNAEKTWREIAKLATPIDSDKEVIISNKCKSDTDFEAYTDKKRIYINLDEKKFRKNFEDIVIPAYKVAAEKLYNVPNKISGSELLKNLAFDTFLLIHFHEQFHPLKCPNSRYDERRISKSLYDGIRKAEKNISRTNAMLKANNSKNLMWDCLVNESFVDETSKTASLEQKIKFVFKKEGREIEYQPITDYPSGILPIIYLTCAQNTTTDIVISLMGLFYTTISFNSEDIRKNAAGIFLGDLGDKNLKEAEAKEIVKKLYEGFVSEINEKTLKSIGIKKQDYIENIKTVTDFENKNYEINQQYFISALTKIFDNPLTRYDSLKGVIQVLSKYIPLNEKQGSPDKNTSGYGEDDEDEKNEAEGGGKEKSEDEMEGDSISDTLDDLLEELPDKEKDELLGEIANGGIGGNGAGAPSGKVKKRIEFLAADEFYKRNAELIELKNPSEENISFDFGTRKVWKLISSTVITDKELSRMNFKQLFNFQSETGLPVLMSLGNGYHRFNQYSLIETPLKSYNSQTTGIEIPDNWIFIQDSSSSMTGSIFVGTGNKFDLLNRVKYGLMKGLVDTAKKLKKDVNFGVVDFSDVTEYRGVDSLVKVYEARTHKIKELSLSPQCGGTYLNSNVFKKIEKDLKPGKTIYTLISDGEMSGADELYNYVTKFTAKPNNAFVFVEVTSKSNIGQRIKELSKTSKAVLYYNVNDVKSIKDKLGSVLIKYG